MRENLLPSTRRLEEKCVTDSGAGLPVFSAPQPHGIVIDSPRVLPYITSKANAEAASRSERHGYAGNYSFGNLER